MTVVVAGPPPAPPATPTLQASVSGSTVTLSGTAPGAAAVEVFEGATSLGTVAVADGRWSKVLEGVAPGEHAYSAVSRDVAGTASASSAPQAVTVAQVAQQTPTPTPPQSPSPTPTPEPQLPAPVTGEKVNVAVKTGKVRFKLPGSNQFVELGAGQQIPVGTTVDTTKGRVTLSSSGAGGKVESADFYDGIFKVTQTKGAKPITVLTLNEALSCPKQGRAASAAAKKKSRKLWGSGKGAFRTTGSYSAATVRGTTWLTQDTCTTTLTRVTQGVVEVRDLAKRKTVLVKAGKRYTARVRGR